MPVRRSRSGPVVKQRFVCCVGLREGVIFGGLCFGLVFVGFNVSAVADSVSVVETCDACVKLVRGFYFEILKFLKSVSDKFRIS